MNRKKIYRFLEFLSIALLGVLIYTCDTTENDIVTDPRKFNWSIDTLTSPRTDQSFRDDIWGASKTDIFTVGFVDAGGSQMWHYDGASWKFVPLQITDGGPLTFPFALNAIEGFSRTNIYASGEKLQGDQQYEIKSLLLHYDGMQWNEVIVPDIGVVGNLTIIRQNELYGGGIGKYFLHFNGAIWTKDSINVSTPLNALIHITDFAEYNNDIYCLYDYQTEDASLAVHYFLKKNTSGWSVVDSFIIDQTHYTYEWGEHLKILPDGDLYCFGSSALLKFNGNDWATILNERHILDIVGPNSSNMFAVGYPGKVFHFNGADWKQITQINDLNFIYTGVWFNGEEAFICGNTIDYPEKSIVWHGKNN